MNVHCSFIVVIALLLHEVCSFVSFDVNSLSSGHRKRLWNKRSARGQREEFSGEKDYLTYLESQAALPVGFKVGTSKLTFVPMENEELGELPMALTVIKADEPTTTFAGMFTRNQFPGGPILVGRRRLAESAAMQVVVVNNKISNVCPGGVTDGGEGDSERVCCAIADMLQVAPSTILPSSTGVIGWRLPVKELVEAVPVAVQALQNYSILPAAVGICTTDRFPKIRRFDGMSKNGVPYSIVGIAKGAGMVEPNMATMLAYVVTDACMSREDMDEALRVSVFSSFNSISVDGDQSTSDTVFGMSSNHVTDVNLDEFRAGLKEVCTGLALDIVRNGEGTQHVIRIAVTGAPSDLFARDLGRFVANGNLLKCALAGSDPNVGRIIGGIGSFLGGPMCKLSETEVGMLTKGLVLTLGGVEIFSKGQFQLDTIKERQLSDYMAAATLYNEDLPEVERRYPANARTVDLDIKLSGALGNGAAVVIGSDLTQEYVEINADYRS